MAIWQSAKDMLRARLLAMDTQRRLLRSQQQARAALRSLERARGPLAAGLSRQARDYAGDVLGGPRHAPWLKVYAAVQGSFKEGWLPDSYYHEFVRPLINGTYAQLSRHRAANSIYFPASALPDVAHIANGLVLSPSGHAISAVQIAAKGHDLVFKPDASADGRSIHFITTTDLDDELLGRLGNGVLQRKLVQHPAFQEIAGRALATLRIGTAVDAAGNPSVSCCYLRFGRAGESHVQSTSQVRVPVSFQTGWLADTGYTADWAPLTAHPDSGRSFHGLEVSRAANCAGRALELHRRIPFARYICWDFAVDQEECIHLLEWEGGQVAFAEATQGPCFSNLEWDRLHLAR